jgi:protein-S-isoprenylcysteine O-methyltransferase Ste14
MSSETTYSTVTRVFRHLPALVLSFLFFRILTPPHRASASDKVVHDLSFIHGFRLLHSALPALNFAGALVNFYAFYEAQTLARPPPFWRSVFAYFVCLSGCLLRLWSYSALGRFFTYQISVRSHHELIGSGPYAWLLHPSYTGLWLAMLGGIPFFLSPWLGHLRFYTIWAARVKLIRTDPRPMVARIETFIRTFGAAFVVVNLLIAVTATHKRITVEEATLRDHFGPAVWDAHAAGKWKLIPFVW